jgi:hypothetical protein
MQPLQLQLEFLAGDGELRADIEDWLLIAPQLKRGARPGWQWRSSDFDFDVKYRSRLGGRIKAYSEPEHRAIAEHITGLRTAPGANDALGALAAPKRAVMLYYPVWTDDHPPDPFTPVAGFALLFAGRSQRTRIIWQVRDTTRPDAAVVPVI